LLLISFIFMEWGESLDIPITVYIAAEIFPT